jgi:hypothetical protein
VKAIEAWAQIFKSKTALIADITKRYALHRKAIKADEATLKADWATGEYFQAGVVAADLLTLAVGPVPAPTSNELPAGLGMPVKAPYEFVLGFVDGFIKDNKLTSIETCYTDDMASF